MEYTERRRGIMGGLALALNKIFYGIIDMIADSVRVMLREKELFLGTGLFLAGVLNVNVGRYCDGNTAEYLSCTRPAVFYYFDTFDITLVILGVFLILVWFVRAREIRS